MIATEMQFAAPASAAIVEAGGPDTPGTPLSAPDAPMPASTGLASWRGVAALTPMLLAACGGGESDGEAGDGLDPVTRAQSQGSSHDPSTGLTLVGALPGSQTPEPPRATTRMSEREAARFLTQATFGIRSRSDIQQLQDQGIEHWLWQQYRAPYALHTSYLDQQRGRSGKDNPSADMSYEAIWRQWLFEEGQLRARMAFALSEIMVISNIAPNLKAYAMSSYMDMLSRNAFGNFRTLLKEVTLHPAMGSYLNLLRSKGSQPNENYAREVLQLFTIGLYKLDIQGNVVMQGGKPVPTYGEEEVKGFAKAFSGWSFGGEGNTDPDMFWKARENNFINWVMPMMPFPKQHDSKSEKRLLNGQILPAGQTPEKDMADALNNIFHHPNVGPFIGRQLIQRFVTSNPSGAYIAHVAQAFNDNGAGVRGDLRAVIHAVLTYKDARDLGSAAQLNYGKQREPVIRMANMLRAFNATTPSASGRTDLHELDNPDESLGQSPLMAPSVFNFFSPGFKAGAIAKAGLVAPEFQITTESSVVGTFNTFSKLFRHGGYGWGKESRLTLNFAPWDALVLKPAELVERMNLLLCCGGMSPATRARLVTMISAMPSKSWQLRARIENAFTLLAMSPDFVIQK